METTQLLTQEEKRIKIYHHLGWDWQPWGKTQVQVFAPEGSKPNWSGEDKATNSIKWPVRAGETVDGVAQDIILRVTADPFGSLDAMHEAEKVLTESQHDNYCVTLHRIVPESYAAGSYEGDIEWDTFFPVIHATAAHRAEAFGLALNLWTKQ